MLLPNMYTEVYYMAVSSVFILANSISYSGTAHIRDLAPLMDFKNSYMYIQGFPLK